MSNNKRSLRVLGPDILEFLAEALTRGNEARVPSDIELLRLYEWAELAVLDYALLQLILARRLDIKWDSEARDFKFARRARRCSS